MLLLLGKLQGCLIKFKNGVSDECSACIIFKNTQIFYVVLLYTFKANGRYCHY